MARLARFTAKIFGSSAGVNQISQFGSLAAGAPAFSTNPGVIQNLSRWASGWFNAVIGGNSPAIEDMNAFCFVMAYQIAYMMQQGVAEWDSATTYYTNNFAASNGDIFVSIADNNLNNPVSDATKWKMLGANNLVARWTLEDATVPFTNISGPHFQSFPQILNQVAISMINAGSAGSTTIRLNVIRAGAPFASATAVLPSNSGNSNDAIVSLSSSLSLLRGDILTCDVVSQAAGTPESLTVEYYGGTGGGVGGGGGGGGSNPAPYIHTINASEITNKGFSLVYVPVDPTRVLITIYGSIQQFPTLDYIVGAPNAADFVSWDSLGMQSQVVNGTMILITYSD